VNRVLLGYVGLLFSVGGCTSHSPVVTHDAGHPAPMPAVSGIAQEPRKFDIPAGDAPVALNEFSRQSNVQVLFDFSSLSGRQTQAVVGMLPPQEALMSMLRDTGLNFTYVDDRTIAIAADR
jgi:hypothetical protein